MCCAQNCKVEGAQSAQCIAVLTDRLSSAGICNIAYMSASMPPVAPYAAQASLLLCRFPNQAGNIANLLSQPGIMPHAQLTRIASGSSHDVQHSAEIAAPMSKPTESLLTTDQAETLYSIQDIMHKGKHNTARVPQASSRN